MICLLVLGLVPPLITYFTVATAWWFSWRQGGNASAVYIPLLGPALLTSWIVLDGRPSLWLIPTVWMGDLGTIVFLLHLPSMMREMVETSRFTVVLKFRGENGLESATLTLHSGGHYLLRKRWARQNDELGILELVEPGTFIQFGNDYELTAHFGLRRVVRSIEEKQGEKAYLVNEEPSPAPEECSLNGWMLEVQQ